MSDYHYSRSLSNEAIKAFQTLDLYLYLKNEEEKEKNPDFSQDRKNVYNVNPRKFFHKKTISKYEELWKQTRNNQMLSDFIDYSHSCYSNRCFENNGIVHIKKNIYQCNFSGIVHKCNVKLGDCPYTLQTNEGSYVCLFSGNVVGTVLVGEDSRRDREDTNSVFTQEQFSQCRIGNLKLKDSGFGSLSTIRNKKYGMPRPKKIDNPNRNRNVNIKDAVDIKVIFKNILKLLFLNQSKRDAVNNSNKNQATKKFFQDVKLYLRQCSGSKVMYRLTDLSKYYDIAFDYKELLPVKENELKNSYYASVCEELWNIATLGSGFNRTSQSDGIKFSVAYLYIISDVKNGDVCDHYIVDNVPSHNDLYYHWNNLSPANTKSKTLTLTIRNFKDIFKEVLSNESYFKDIEDCRNAIKLIVKSAISKVGPEMKMVKKIYPFINMLNKCK